jgi:two-component system, LuxR family, sensor kinase FixL
MRQSAEEPVLEETLARLQRNREALPWSERRELASSLAETLGVGKSPETALALVYLLGDDPKPEVRKEIADLLLLVPNDDFIKLAARFSEDTSAFVQKAVARALDRRRKGHRESLQRRKGFDHVESQYANIEKMHGTLAAERARKIADKQFDILVGSVVHDIRGILTSLTGGFSTLLGQLKVGEADPVALKDGLTRMNERLLFLARFVDDMRSYSQSTPEERRRERIAEVVNEAKSIVLDDLKGRGIEVDSVSLSVDVPESITAEVARHQVVAAVMHVLKNAFEAFEAKGQGSKKIEIRARVLNAGRVEIVVEDNGPGIAVEDLLDIRQFQPGTTTKKNQGGTGFGLPTAYRYVEAHGGTLAIESEEREGTAVTMTLPVEEEDGED